MGPEDQPIPEITREAVESILGDGRDHVHVEPRAVYYGIYVEGVLASICSLAVRRKLAVLSMDYTLPAYRGRGLHQQLIAYRLIRAKALGAEMAQATCLAPSIRNYLKAGFAVVQQYKHGWRVRRML
jgi:GNAT superfamily N-acetyltransferase